MLALSAALCKLAAAPAYRQVAAGGPDPGNALPGLQNQLIAAGLAAAACCQLGYQLDLPSRDAFRVAAAAQLVFQAFPWLLAGLRRDVQDSPAEVQAACSATLWLACFSALTAFAAGPGLLLPSEEQAEAAAAFAGSTAHPEVLLPFLRELVAALLALPASFRPGQPAGGISAVVCDCVHGAHR